VAVSKHGLQTKNVQKFLRDTQNTFDLIILEQHYHESWLMFGEIFEAPIITISKFLDYGLIHNFSFLISQMLTVFLIFTIE
jgi:hypothetical protein